MAKVSRRNKINKLLREHFNILIVNKINMNRKILISAVLGAMAIGSLSSATQSWAAVKAVSSAKATCIQHAVARRETSLIAAFDAYHKDLRNSMGTRKEALKNAWGKTILKERRDALKLAWKNFRNDRVNLRKTYRDSQKSAWNIFKDEQRDCKTTTLQEDNAGQAEDNNI